MERSILQVMNDLRMAQMERFNRSHKTLKEFLEDPDECLLDECLRNLADIHMTMVRARDRISHILQGL